MDLSAILMDSKLISMAVSAIKINLGSIGESNFTIILGIFVTVTVMGTSILYDKRQHKNKNLYNDTGSKPSSVSGHKANSLGSGSLNGFSGFNKKLSNLIPKKINKNNSGNSGIKSTYSKSGIKKAFGSLRRKIPSFSLSSRSKKMGNVDGNGIQQTDNKMQTAQFNGIDKFSSFDVDKIVESKKSEFDFDDDLLSEMSTAGSIKESKSASLNKDLSFDTDEFDLGFEDTNDESSEDDLLFNTGSKKLKLNDEHDSLLASLKNDIVIKNEKKIDFMTEMQGENLDLKLIKSELEEVLKKLNKYRRYSNNN
jgi:hypothetical protein